MNNAHIGTKDSRTSRCYRISNEICDILFKPLRSGYQLTLDDVLQIINRISADKRAPRAPMKNWGDIIAAMFSMKQLLTALGTEGTNLQLQCKHAITCSVLDGGDGDALVIGNALSNKVLLHDLLPHLSWKRDKWIADCRQLRSDFESGNSRNICKLYEDAHHQSLVAIIYRIC